MSENREVIASHDWPNGKKPKYWLGTKVRCLVGKEEGRTGKVVGFYETIGLDYSPDSDLMYFVEFESDAHGWCRWARLFSWDEMERI